MADIQDNDPTVAMTLARRLAHYRNRAAPTGDELAERTVAQRSRPGITQRELSARMSALGFEMSREAIANVESGGRPDSKNTNKTRAEAVTVTELLGLAIALDVPPPLLVTPLGDVEDGVRLGRFVFQPHRLALFFCGDHLPEPNDPDGTVGPGFAYDEDTWLRNQEPLDLFRDLQEQISAANTASELKAQFGDSDDEDLRRMAIRRFDFAVLEVDNTLRRLARDGVSTPAMPEAWADHVARLRMTAPQGLFGSKEGE